MEPAQFHACTAGTVHAVFQVERWANLAYLRHSGPDYGLKSQVKVRKTMQGVHSSLGSGAGESRHRTGCATGEQQMFDSQGSFARSELQM